MLQVDTSTPILVLRQSFAEFQHAVLGVARSAGRLGIPVYAVRMHRLEPATRSRYVRAGFQRLRDASDAQWLEALMDVDTGGARPVLLPIDDRSAVFVDDHHAALRERFLMPRDPGGLHRRLASKRMLSELTTGLGLASPTASFPASEAELIECAERSSYPIVLKRADPLLPTRDPSAPSVLIAHTRSGLIEGYRRMESLPHLQVLVQEYIPGGSDTIWMFNGYFGRDSECLCAFTGRKLRQRGPWTGPATLGVCAWNKVVADAAIRLMRAVGYHGIVDMGFRYDERDGQYKLLDVNPRMGSTFRLFVGENGLDVVRAAYLDLTGQRVPTTRSRDGRRWLVEPYDMVAALQLARAGALSRWEWLRSLRAVDEAAWWARDDPVPFLAMVASLGPEAVRYGLRRRQQRPPISPQPRSQSRNYASGRTSVPTEPGARSNEDPTDSQPLVDRYFGSAAAYWHEVYGEDGLRGRIYRERMEAVLRWVQDLGLPAEAAALEVGCGAGLLAARLAQRELRVVAVDASAEMVELAERHAAEVGSNSRLRVVQADVHGLPFASDTFDLVLAVGLLPWLHDAQTGIAEMTRVLGGGGWLIVTADNRARLNLLTEPRENPLLAPLKQVARALKRAPGKRGSSATSHLHLPSHVDRLLVGAGVRPVRRTTIGFGPFTVLGHAPLSEPAGLRLHLALSALSAQRMPRLRRMGWHYLVAARKPER